MHSLFPRHLCMNEVPRQIKSAAAIQTTDCIVDIHDNPGTLQQRSNLKTRQSEMADLARRATRDLSQFHMGGPNFDTGRSWKL